MEYYWAKEKEGNLAIHDNMDCLRVYHAKWNKPGREDKYHIYDLTSMWRLKNKYGQQTVGYHREGAGGWVKHMKGIKRYKLQIAK